MSKELKTLAEAATPGPWVQWVGNAAVFAGEPEVNRKDAILPCGGGRIATVCEGDLFDPSEQELADHAYIAAANPSAILQLLAERDALLAERDALIASSAKWKRDSELLDAIEGECWDVRFLSTPNADAGDSSISIEIVGHFMAEPRERVVGENYNENLRAALEQAMTADAYPPARPEYDERGRPVAALQGEQP